MEEDPARDLKRSDAGGGGGGIITASSSSTTSPAKQQQRAFSCHTIINSNDSKPPSPPFSPSVLNNSISDRGGGGGGGGGMKRWKKEEANGLRWSSGNTEEAGGSGDEEACIFRSPPTATTTDSLSSRKRVRLRGNVAEGCNAVDPAMVPRRLRSVMNKRAGQSASPPLPDSKRQQHRASNGTRPPLVNGARRLKQIMLLDPITKDEEEVAEILASLPSLIVASKPIKEDRRVSEEIPGMKKTSVSLSEVSKEGVFLLPCTGAEATYPSSFVEQSPEEINKTDEPCIKEHSMARTGSLKFDIESNGTPQPDLQGAIASKNEHAEIACLWDAVKSSNPPGASRQFYSANGVLEPMQFGAPPQCKPEIGLPCSRFGSALWEKGLQSAKQNPVGREETTPDVCLLSNNGHGPSTTSSSSKATGQPYPATGNKLPTEKLPPVSANRKWSWERCTTHVYISHLIQNHQKGQNPGVHVVNEPVGSRDGRNSMTSCGADGPIIHEVRTTRVLPDRRLLQAQQASALSGPYAQQKQVYDFLSLSASCGNYSPGNGVEPSGQHHVPYLHSQVPPHHSTVPFPFPHCPYTSPYPDQLAAAATQQLQLPHYIGNPFYGQQQMVHTGGGITKQQQQQMWQAQMALHRPSLGIPKGANGRQQAASASHLPSSQPLSLLPLSSEMLNRASYAHHNLQQQQHPLPPPIPSLRSSRPKKQHQDRHRDGPEGPAQLQLLCHAERT